MKPYPQYKITDLDWLPRVPTHWEIKRAKLVFKTINERSLTGEEELLSVSHITGVTKRKANVTMFKAESYVGYKVCQPNDLVINSMWAWMGALGVAPLHGIVSTAYSVYRMDESQLFPSFANLVLRIKWYAQDFENRSKGIWTSRLILSDDAFGNTIIAIPPLDEQKRIVSYLAAKNWEIESYIAAKRLLLLRLKELSAAVISRAVTQGINPNVKTKASGVEWLGDVPEHWDVAALKYRFSVQLGKMLDGDKIKGNNLAPYLRNTDVQWARINVSELPVMDFSDADREKFSLRPNDLLVCEGGEVGRSAIWTKELEKEIGTCFYQKALHRLRPKRGDLPQWMFYLLFSACQSSVFTQGVEKSTIFHLPADDFRQYKFPFPSLEEQVAIVAHIEAQLATIQEARTRIEREIELARELWATLVAEVVTGQIDVSDWDGAEEPVNFALSLDVVEDEESELEDEDELSEVELTEVESEG